MLLYTIISASSLLGSVSGSRYIVHLMKVALCHRARSFPWMTRSLLPTLTTGWVAAGHSTYMNLKMIRFAASQGFRMCCYVRTVDFITTYFTDNSIWGACIEHGRWCWLHSRLLWEIIERVVTLHHIISVLLAHLHRYWMYLTHFDQYTNDRNRPNLPHNGLGMSPTRQPSIGKCWIILWRVSTAFE